MKVKELIEQLQKGNSEARVFAGYDGNIVVNKPGSVEEIKSENEIGVAWWGVRVGDVVILGDQ
jgi:hypothetical protein